MRISPATRLAGTGRRPAALAALAVTLTAATAWGQFGIRTTTNPPRPALLERNAPIENLLKRAEDAIARQDWKAAIDALQRILDDPSGGLLPQETDAAPAKGVTYYRSARLRATTLLASMPPEGQAAYRLLNDGRARTLLAEGISAHDESRLRAIVERYPITSVADDAAVELAAWRIDRGRAAEALDLLDRVEAMGAGADVPLTRRTFLRAACWLLLGESQRAAEVLAALPADAISGEGIAARLEALAEFCGSEEGEALALTTSAPEESWPLAGGGLRRQALMPPVAPELQPNLPWRYALPTDYPDWWERHVQESKSGERKLPAIEMIVSDGRVFVRSLAQLVALDLESLDEIWVTDPPVEATSDERLRLLSFGYLESAQPSYSDRDRLLYDTVGNTISAAFGLVFAIDRAGSDTPMMLVSDRRAGVRIQGLPRGTRLVARRVETGELAWQQGRTANPTDPLGAVQFLSAPIPVRDDLWVVYAKGNDFYLGALSPANGTLRRSLLLLSVDELQTPGLMHQAIYPASDGATVYIPTNVGVVLAVDVEEFALRWAVQYPRGQTMLGDLEPEYWSPGPPALAATTLLVAAPDSNQLLALDRTTGEIQWTRQRRDGEFYLLAADERRVWLGGETLTCLATRDGSAVWAWPGSTSIQATGRAAVCGSNILVPTIGEVVVADADTGEPGEPMALPSDQLPLGNLLCIAGAALSADPNEIRKFPDLTEAYPRALARHEADPEDEKAALRLAWIELLRKSPERAYAALEHVRPTPSQGPRLTADLARLRVDALLGMAAAEGAPLDDAIRYLEEAVRLAAGDRERLRATMALAAKLRAAGRQDDAYLTLWELGLTPAGDGYITVEPKLRNKARRVIAEVLAKFERDLTARQLADIAARTRAEFEQAVAGLTDDEQRPVSLARLAHLAELNDAGSAGQAALVALAADARRHGQYERSEQYLRAAIAQDRAADMTAEALRDLAAQYLLPGQSLPHEADALLARLETDYGRAEIASAADDSSRTGREEAARLRKDLAAQAKGPLTSGLTPHRFIFKDQQPRRGARGDVELLDRRGELREAAQRRILVQDGSLLAAFERLGNQADWMIRLRMLGEQTSDSTLRLGVIPRANAWKAATWTDGQTGVAITEQGLFGYGLLSGRRLWGAEYEESETADLVRLRQRLIAVAGGRLYYAPRRGVLACSSLIDADDLQWERILHGEKLDKVFVADGYCLTLDSDRERVTVYSAENGRHYSAIRFVQPDADDHLIELAYVRGHVVGPAGRQSLACYSVYSGELNWSKELTAPLHWVFKPGEGYVGAVCEGGEVLLIDVLSGDVVWKVTVPQAAEGFAEGVLHEGSLLLMPVTLTGRGDEPALVSLDLASGSIRWTREDFGATGANRHALGRLLHLAKDVVPMFRRMSIEGVQNPGTIGEVAVQVYDKKTGEPLGPAVRTKHTTMTSEQLTGAFGLWPERFIVETNNSLLELPIEPLDSSEPPPGAAGEFGS